MQSIIINGIKFQYTYDKGSDIIVYDENENMLGKWDNLNDLRYDADNHPEWFKPEKEEQT